MELKKEPTAYNVHSTCHNPAAQLTATQKGPHTHVQSSTMIMASSAY